MSREQQYFEKDMNVSEISEIKSNGRESFYRLTAGTVAQFQAFLDSASIIGHFSLVAIDNQGRRITEPSGVYGFCRQAQHNPDIYSLCLRSKEFGLSQALNDAQRFSYFCPFGFMETVLPITKDSRPLGAIFCRQFKCQNTPPGLIDLSMAMGEQTSAALSDPILKAFHQAAPNLDYIKLDKLLQLIEQVSAIFVEADKPGYSNQPYPLESEKKASELGSSALNMGFLINAVSSLANLAVLESAWKTNSMAVLLADQLKSLELAALKEVTSIGDEIADAERYLAMQKLRYAELLEYKIHKDKDIEKYALPTDVIMPLVERAVCFGLASRADTLEVLVKAWRNERELIVEVVDNRALTGQPKDDFSSVPFRQSSEMRSIIYRLESAMKRLSEFAGNASLTITPGLNSGTLGRICCPILPNDSIA